MLVVIQPPFILTNDSQKQRAIGATATFNQSNKTKNEENSSINWIYVVLLSCVPAALVLMTPSIKSFYRYLFPPEKEELSKRTNELTKDQRRFLKYQKKLNKESSDHESTRYSQQQNRHDNDIYFSKNIPHNPEIEAERLQQQHQHPHPQH